MSFLATLLDLKFEDGRYCQLELISALHYILPHFATLTDRNVYLCTTPLVFRIVHTGRRQRQHVICEWTDSWILRC